MEIINDFTVPILWVIIVIFLLIFESVGLFVVLYKVLKNAKKISANAFRAAKNTEDIEKLL